MESGSYKKILIATDGSENVKNAVFTGVEIAQATGASIVAVYVVVNTSASVAAQRGADWAEALREHLTEDGKHATDYIEKSAKDAGVEVESFLLAGDPGEEIIEFAQEGDFDLIVMGTLGRTGLKRFLLGSVAEKVVRNSKLPVLVVP